MAKKHTITVKESKQCDRPAGLSIARNGENLKLTWRMGSPNYDDGQEFQRKYHKVGKSDEWVKDVLKSVKNTYHNFPLKKSSYYPNQDKNKNYFSKVTKVSARVRGNRKKEHKVEEVSKKKYNDLKKKYPDAKITTKSISGDQDRYFFDHTINYTMSKWHEKDFKINPPKKPKLSYGLHQSFDNISVFSWQVENSNTAHEIFTDVQYQSALAENCYWRPETDKDDDKHRPFKWKDTTISVLSSSSTQIKEDTSKLSPKTDSKGHTKVSKTRYFRIRSRGPGGYSKWVYGYHVYSRPNFGKIVASKAWLNYSGKGYTCRIVWTADESKPFPIDSSTIEYLIDIPGYNGSCPRDADNWTTAGVIDDSNDKNDKNSYAFTIDRVIGRDQCLFVRVNTKHDGYISYGEPETVSDIENKSGNIKYRLEDPVINSFKVTKTDLGYVVSITAENKSDVPDSMIAVYFECDEKERGSKKKAKKITYRIGVIKHSESGQQVFFRAPNIESSSDVVRSDQKFYIQAFSTNDVYSKTVTRSEEKGKTYKYVTYKLSGVLMESSKVYDGGALISAPKLKDLKYDKQTSSINVSWSSYWNSYEAVELSWADVSNAWESTSQPSTYRVDKSESNSWNISGIENGKIWYVKARFISYRNDGEMIGPWSEAKSINLSTVPEKPILKSNKYVLTKGTASKKNSFRLSWGYYCDDGSEQQSATIYLWKDGKYKDIETISGTKNYFTMIPYDRNWGSGDHRLAVKVQSKSGKTSSYSDPIHVVIAAPISDNLTFSHNLLVRQESGQNLNYLRGYPLKITVGGVSAGTYTATIKRAENYPLNRPDESRITGYEGEVVAQKSIINPGTITFNLSDIDGDLDKGCIYRVELLVEDQYGQTDRGEFEFTVDWANNAVMPSATAAIDYDYKVALIYIDKPKTYEKTTDQSPVTGKTYYMVKPQEEGYEVTTVEYVVVANPVAEDMDDYYEQIILYEVGDTCDIYRLSVDKPELIYENAIPGNIYIDPYPTIGMYGGHRIVYKTIEGNYAIAQRTIEDGVEATATLDAILDLGYDDGDYFEFDANIINFGVNEVMPMYNTDLSSTWSKDFKETKYLGGSIQGDWNPGVSKSVNLSSVTPRFVEPEEIELMRRLATYTDVCHVRTRDGSSYDADVQISESLSYQDYDVASYTYTITRVDNILPQGMDFNTWLSMHPDYDIPDPDLLSRSADAICDLESGLFSLHSEFDTSKCQSGSDVSGSAMVHILIDKLAYATISNISATTGVITHDSTSESQHKITWSNNIDFTYDPSSTTPLDTGTIAYDKSTEHVSLVYTVRLDGGNIFLDIQDTTVITYTYFLTSDEEYVTGKQYYELSGGSYVPVADSDGFVYFGTEDVTPDENKEYYILVRDAEVPKYELVNLGDGYVYSLVGSTPVDVSQVYWMTSEEYDLDTDTTSTVYTEIDLTTYTSYESAEAPFDPDHTTYYQLKGADDPDAEPDEDADYEIEFEVVASPIEADLGDYFIQVTYNGYYGLTGDEFVDETKEYYEKSNHTYTLVESPDDEEVSTYYELLPLDLNNLYDRAAVDMSTIFERTAIDVSSYYERDEYRIPMDYISASLGEFRLEVTP